MEQSEGPEREDQAPEEFVGEEKKSLLSRLNLFHWIIIVIALLVIVAGAATCMSSGMGPLRQQELQDYSPDAPVP